MQNEYSNSIRNMIFSNEYLKSMLLEGERIDEYSSKMVNLELFFLAFKIFEDEFKELDIYDYWKELLIKQDYIINGDKILFGNREISFQLIEIMFINLMIKFRNKRSNKIVDITQFIKYEEKEEEQDSAIVSFEKKEDNSIEEVRANLDKYIVDKSKNTNDFLNDISSNFKLLVYDSIINVYNKLKEYRTDRMFKTNISLIGEDNKFLDELAIFLLSMYPIGYYGKDKQLISYDYLEMPDIMVDPNHFKFDSAWENLTNRLEIINKKIELLTDVKNRTRNILEKNRYGIKIAILEREKKRVLDQIIDIGEVQENIQYDGDYIEASYSGELLNRHIIYNLNIAINKGYVDFRKNVQGKEEMVFYSINGSEVDFIMHIEVDKLYMAIDNMDLVNSFKNGRSYVK